MTVWVVRHGDDLCVRSAYGRTSTWLRGTQVRHEGHIQAGGVEKVVNFVDADRDIDDQIEAALRTKCRRYAASLINYTVNPEARSATIKLVPRSRPARGLGECPLAGWVGPRPGGDGRT